MTDYPKALAAARDALAKLREHDGGTRYNGDDDDAGERACCLVASWKPHDSDCPHAVAVAEFDNLLAALDAARGEAVATVQTITSLVGETRKCIIGPAEVIDSLPVGTAVYAAPPAAAVSVRDESPVYVCEGLTVPAWTVQYANELGAYFKAQNSGFWAIGPIQSRYGEPQQPATAVSEGYALVPAEDLRNLAFTDFGRAFWTDGAEAAALRIRAMLAADKENNND